MDASKKEPLYLLHTHLEYISMRIFAMMKREVKDVEKNYSYYDPEKT